jgi:hypothetical protein
MKKENVTEVTAGIDDRNFCEFWIVQFNTNPFQMYFPLAHLPIHFIVIDLCRDFPRRSVATMSSDLHPHLLRRLHFYILITHEIYDPRNAFLHRTSDLAVATLTIFIDRRITSKASEKFGIADITTDGKVVPTVNFPIFVHPKHLPSVRTDVGN